MSEPSQPVTPHRCTDWEPARDTDGRWFCEACGEDLPPLVVPDPPQPRRGPTVVMSIVSGGTVQQVTDVLRVDHRRGRVLIRCHPDTTPRWVSLLKPRTDN